MTIAGRLLVSDTGPIPPLVRRNLAPLRSLVLAMSRQPHEARATLFLEIRR